jgi:hypothetical protein
MENKLLGHEYAKGTMKKIWKIIKEKCSNRSRQAQMMETATTTRPDQFNSRTCSTDL